MNLRTNQNISGAEVARWNRAGDTNFSKEIRNLTFLLRLEVPSDSADGLRSSPR